MNFKDKLERVGVKGHTLTFDVTEDVYNELLMIAAKNDCDIEQLMRDMIDYFLITLPQ